MTHLIDGYLECRTSYNVPTNLLNSGFQPSLFFGEIGPISSEGVKLLLELISLAFERSAKAFRRGVVFRHLLGGKRKMKSRNIQMEVY